MHKVAMYAICPCSSTQTASAQCFKGNLSNKIWVNLILKAHVFWVVEPCNLVEVHRHFKARFELLMEGASTFETSMNFYQTTRRNQPEDSHLYTYSPL
jgi:hypothetical protein